MELTIRDKEKLRGIVASVSKNRDNIIELSLIERDKEVKGRLGASIDQLDDAMTNLTIIINQIRG